MSTVRRSDGGNKRSAESAAPIFDRAPPHNRDAEMGVLGSIMLVPEVCDEIATIVRADDFYDDAHAKIFRHMDLLRRPPCEPRPESIEPRGWRRGAWRERSTAEPLGDGFSLGRIDSEPAERIARHLDSQLALGMDRLDARAQGAQVA